MKNYTCENKISSLPLGSCTFNGAIAEQMERFFYQRINSPHARNMVYQESIAAYRNQVDDATELFGIWQGEFWGKWIISAARAAEYTRNAELASFVRSAAYELISLRRADGCISTYKNDTFFVCTATKEDALRIMGWKECKWNWNIWCRKYALWGLIASWELLGEPAILHAASGLADQLITSLEETNTDIHDTGVFRGLPSCSILKPMLLLYRYTENQRYLDFADTIVSGWNRSDGKLPNLIANPLAGKPVFEWSDVKDHTWTKVYEMLSCYDGLLEYYRVTGKKDALDASEALFKLLIKYERNQMYSVGFNDHFANASILMESITEPCDVIHWMRFCGELFKLTGKNEYLDAFELAYCNAFLGSTTRDGSWGARGVRSSCSHFAAPEQAKLKYNHCCVNNMPRGFINAPECAVMKDEKSVYLNFCFPLQSKIEFADGSNIEVKVSDGYLQYGKVSIEVEAQKASVLQLRIPAWSKTTTVTGAGKSYSPGAGTFWALEIPAGKSSFSVEFDRTVVLKDVSGADIDTLDPWYKRRYLSDEQGKLAPITIAVDPKSVLQIGPVLLARSKVIGNTACEMFETPSVNGKNYKCELTPADIEGVYAGFNAVFTAPDGSSFSTKVCDYASAGNMKLEDRCFFSMFF